MLAITPKIIGCKALKQLIYTRKPLLRPFKKVESRKVQSLKVVVLWTVIQNSKKFHNGHFEYQILESNGKIWCIEKSVF